MSATRLICEKCGFVQIHCTCSKEHPMAEKESGEGVSASSEQSDLAQNGLQANVPKRCDCAVCRRADTFVEIMERLPEYTEFIESVDRQLEHAETDAVYWRMKYEGTWPGDAVTDQHPAPKSTDASVSAGDAGQME